MHPRHPSEPALNSSGSIAPTLRSRRIHDSHSTSFMKPIFNVHAETNLDEDLADVGGALLGSVQHRIAFDFDGTRALDILAEVYDYRIIRAYRWADRSKLQWSRLVLRFAHDAFVLAFRCGSGRVVAGTAAKAEAIYAEIAGLLAEQMKPKEPNFYMLRYESNDFTADAIDNLPDPVDDEFLRLAYGDDALPWVEAFASRTRERQGGLTILEGPPGTGKTSLVSEMIRRLRDTHLFYVLPACNDGSLTAPELASFWQGQHRQHPDRVKVVVMEDAERMLVGRSTVTRDAVAAVLNIADGLLGRMLRLHLVCSINARFEDLDSAIQRPGRLTNYRRFGPIPRERAIALAAKQGSAFVPHPEVDEFTLAEVLQPSTIRPPTGRRQIGFGAVR
jgi:hypothetical protein